MGLFRKRVKVANHDNPSKFFDGDFLVDTGAVFSSVPEEILDGLGVEVKGEKAFGFADGTSRLCRIGFCDFEIEGLVGRWPCPVMFAPVGSPFLLGATTLETFLVEVDPVKKELRPTTAIMGGFTPLLL